MTDRLDIKQDFVIFEQNPDLVYLDSASTTLVPKPAVAATSSFLNSVIASTRRGAHRLAVRGGAIVEDVRESLAQFLNTEKSQISFQKSIPSAIASLIYGYDWKTMNKTKIVVAQSEENSVLVAILRVAEVLGLTVETVPIDVDGVLPLEILETSVDDETGFRSFALKKSMECIKIGATQVLVDQGVPPNDWEKAITPRDILKQHYPNVDIFQCKHCGTIIVRE